MPALEFANYSVADLGIILADYNVQSVGIFSFWFVFYMALMVILFSLTLGLGFRISSLVTTFFMTILSILIASMGLLTWGQSLFFGAIFIIALFASFFIGD